MRKDNIRDYATAAFRYYALVEKNKAQITNNSEELDYAAVKHVISVINMNSDVGRAIESIYFYEADKPLRSNDITMRVIALSQKLYTSERTIYRHLATARRLFANTRGLRIV